MVYFPMTSGRVVMCKLRKHRSSIFEVLCAFKFMLCKLWLKNNDFLFIGHISCYSTFNADSNDQVISLMKNVWDWKYIYNNK